MIKALTGFALLVAITATALFISSRAEADGPPLIPHPVAGREQCLTCHGEQGIKPVPANHVGFDQGTCLSCHLLSTKPAPDNECLQCHAQPGLSKTLGNGEQLPLHVDPQVFATSVHGSKLLCSDCHSNTTLPHLPREIPSRREYSVAQYELCKRCHFANYTKTLDSIHFEMFASGNLDAPICTDCHGAHDVTRPAQPRASISQTCSQCHQEISQTYLDSVHGKALVGDNNYDAPVCTDCHTSHTIEDPRTAAFRLESIDICSNCHSNEAVMKKYGISTNVVKSYLNDFHGRAVALTGKQGKDIWAKEAVCTDCHGVHDIQSADSPESPVIKANLVATCQQCHPGATDNFPGSWLSHYQPSLTKAPMVFLVGWFYRLLIPFILVGLSVHILLDLWRAITNR
ncbi:MAG: cytochrome c3 family protein [Chloroflexi bacterium]|nr:cytochrome c3 family protein [Chloroflexota bacterium]